MTETGETRIIDWNEAWADRYGGGWPKVQTLIKTSRPRWEFLDKNEEKGRQAQIDNERLLQEAAEKSEFIAKDSALLAQARANVAERARRSARLVSLAVSVGALILLGVAGFAFWEARKSIADQTRTLAALSRAATRDGSWMVLSLHLPPDAVPPVSSRDRSCQKYYTALTSPCVGPAYSDLATRGAGKWSAAKQEWRPGSFLVG